VVKCAGHVMVLWEVVCSSLETPHCFLVGFFLFCSSTANHTARKFKEKFIVTQDYEKIFINHIAKYSSLKKIDKRLFGIG
jgi:hypothetical protein